LGFLSDSKEKKERERAREDLERATEERFQQAADLIATADPANVAAGMEQLRTQDFDALPAEARDATALVAVRMYADVALADDRLSAEEGQRLEDDRARADVERAAAAGTASPSSARASKTPDPSLAQTRGATEELATLAEHACRFSRRPETMWRCISPTAHLGKWPTRVRRWTPCSGLTRRQASMLDGRGCRTGTSGGVTPLVSPARRRCLSC
jgi:hypothetical protein